MPIFCDKNVILPLSFIRLKPFGESAIKNKSGEHDKILLGSRRLERMKSTYSEDDITSFLTKKYGELIILNPVVEGQESQVFSFRHNDADFIFRIHPNIEGFRKDDYVHRSFSSQKIPIPKIVEYGDFNESHAFCISEKAKGITFQDADEQTVETLLPDIMAVWAAIGEIDISKTKGYGIFSSKDGNAPHDSWKDFLLSILDESKYDWEKIKKIKEVDSDLVEAIKESFLELIQYCPEVRKLRHGDFGSNNVLVDQNVPAITGIIDWDNAAYGDSFYDVNGFWRPWLMCMEKTAVYWEQEFGHLPNYNERIKCYQLHTGLEEIYENALDGDMDTLNWCQKRCRQILLG